jgi:DMSO/TMAO reductase YedYZ molybdopterin-dependent catalytic subunit
MSVITRGFAGRGRRDVNLPPGQYLTEDFPVLSAGPDFLTLPSEEFTVDLHCVTKWSKLGTHWRGVPIETILSDVDTEASHLMAHSYGGYTTNVPLDDLLEGRAWVAYEYDGMPLPAEHGGPARLLVPHLYLWKSAKWLRELRLMLGDEPGFWESAGYHIYGDPWQEQRYWGD